MKSTDIFPLNQRLKHGKFRKLFSQENFSEMLSILPKYINAIEAADNEARAMGKTPATDNFIGSKRIKETETYIGFSKMAFYAIQNLLYTYHVALKTTENQINGDLNTKDYE